MKAYTNESGHLRLSLDKEEAFYLKQILNDYSGPYKSESPFTFVSKLYNSINMSEQRAELKKKHEQFKKKD